MDRLILLCSFGNSSRGEDKMSGCKRKGTALFISFMMVYYDYQLPNLLYCQIMSNQMQGQQLTIKFHQMGVLLLLDIPNQLQFGIDNMTWKVGTKFKGLKLIPLGTHIITYALKNENYQFPIKKFIWFGAAASKDSNQEDRIQVFRWCNKSERFGPVRGEQADGYREGVRKYHFDCYLGQYPQSNIQFWSTNTKYITKQVLDKLDPIEYYESSNQQYEASNKTIQQSHKNPDLDSPSQSQQQAEIDFKQQSYPNSSQTPNPVQTTQQQQHQTIKKNIDFGGNIYYSEIPRRLSEESNHTSQINIDRTEILEKIVISQWGKYEVGVLGELQYSFVAFLVGQCLDSYNQWKKLMVLMSSSEKAFDSHKELMLQFIAVFCSQLSQFPSDFFYDQLSKDSFLISCLHNFRTYQTQKTINKKALSRIVKLLTLIQQKFKYNVREELEEENPVVVEQGERYF